MSLFESRSSKERKSALMAAVSMSVQDGHIDPNEVKACCLVAARLGCSEREMQDVLKSPGSISRMIPSSHEDRMLSLMDLLFVAYADGEFSSEEKEAFASIAMAYEVPPAECAALILAMESGETAEQILSKA